MQGEAARVDISAMCDFPKMLKKEYWGDNLFARLAYFGGNWLKAPTFQKRKK